MTDRIDLDDREESDDENDDRSFADSVWRDDGPAPEPADGPADETAGGSDVDDRRDDGAADETDHDGGDGADDAMPHVPRPSKGDPAGIPAEQGGGGAGTATGKGTTGERGGSSTSPAPPDGADEQATDAGTADAGSTASGPHGGGVDDMTMALTYRAARRLANPPAVVADAKGWTDWLGIVGDVEPHVINRFQREHGIDVDFFSGSDPPGERLAGIGEHSMFYAERMVVVGLEGADEPIAETADWEFVPLSKAAGEAGWTLADDGETSG